MFQCRSIFDLNSFTSFANPAPSGKEFQSFIILCENCCNRNVVLQQGFSNLRLWPWVDDEAKQKNMCGSGYTLKKIRVGR